MNGTRWVTVRWCGKLAWSQSNQSESMRRNLGVQLHIRHHHCQLKAICTSIPSHHHVNEAAPQLRQNTFSPPSAPTQHFPPPTSSSPLHAELATPAHCSTWTTAAAPLPLATSLQASATPERATSATRPIAQHGEQTILPRTTLPRDQMDRHRLDLLDPRRDNIHGRRHGEKRTAQPDTI